MALAIPNLLSQTSRIRRMLSKILSIASKRFKIEEVNFSINIEGEKNADLRRDIEENRGK